MPPSNDISSKQTEIRNKLQEFGYHTSDFNEILDNAIIEQIYDIIINNHVQENYNDPLLYHYTALHYEIMQKHLYKITHDELFANDNITNHINYNSPTVLSDISYLQTQRHNQIINTKPDILIFAAKHKQYCKLAADNNISNAINNYGRILQHEGHTEEAIFYYKKGIDNNNIFSIHNYIHILIIQKNIDEAQYYISMALNLVFNDLYNIEKYESITKNIINFIPIAFQNMEELYDHLNSYDNCENIINHLKNITISFT